MENDKGVTLFIDAPSGTYKTFLTKCCLQKFARKKNCPCKSITERATILLDGGGIVHSMFWLPLNLVLKDFLKIIKGQSPTNLWTDHLRLSKHWPETSYQTVQDLKDNRNNGRSDFDFYWWLHTNPSCYYLRN